MIGIRKIGINAHIFGNKLIGSPVELIVDYTTTQFVFKFKAPSTATVKINWGDGTSEEVVGQDAVIITKTSSYPMAGTYYFSVTGDVTDLTWIDVGGQAFVSGDVSGWSALTNLTRIEIDGTGVSGNIESWVTLTSLGIILGQSSSMSGDLSLLSGLPLVYINLEYTDIDWDTTTAWSGTFSLLTVKGTSLTSTQVDNFIAATSTLTNSTLNVAGLNAHRTAASNDDLNTLLANGNTITLNDVLGAEMVKDGDMSAATNWDVTDPSWSIAAGVAAYDDLNDDAGLLQVDGNMVSSIAVDTVYRTEFKTAATPTNADIAIKNSAEDVVYFAKATYTDGTHVIYFTSPSDISGGGLGYIAYQSGDAFDLDDVSLKTVTLS